MKKLLLTLALILFASSAISADFIKVTKVYYQEEPKEITLNIDNIYKIQDSTYFTSKAAITSTISTYGRTLDTIHVTQTKEQIESWINMKN